MGFNLGITRGTKFGAGGIEGELSKMPSGSAPRIAVVRDASRQTERFVAAIEEAFLAERGFFELGSRSAQGPADSDSADVVPGSSHGQEGPSNGGNGTCKGCGRTISFTKNRKSESDQHLCIACSKLYKERRYCGVCERVWYDTDGGSFTQCDGCEIWVHTECIKTYTEEVLKNIKYFCPACMAKGKMKATTVIPSAIDETRCENENLNVELHDTTPVYIDDYEGLYLRKDHIFDYNFNTDEFDESGVKCLCQAPNSQDTWRDSFYCIHNIPFFCLMGHFGFIVAFFLSIESINVNSN